jgi:hypothetical protein
MVFPHLAGAAADRLRNLMLPRSRVRILLHLQLEPGNPVFWRYTVPVLIRATSHQLGIRQGSPAKPPQADVLTFAHGSHVAGVGMGMRGGAVCHISLICAGFRRQAWLTKQFRVRTKFKVSAARTSANAAADEVSSLAGSQRQ